MKIFLTYKIMMGNFDEVVREIMKFVRKNSGVVNS